MSPTSALLDSGAAEDRHRDRGWIVSTHAKRSYSAHALMENRNGLLMDFRVDQADGQAEWRNANSA